MLHKLEKYADNLEVIVQQRTADLVEEKHKTDMLLHRMLPTYERLIASINLLRRQNRPNTFAHRLYA